MEKKKYFIIMVNDNKIGAHRLEQTFELIETVKELSKSKDKAEHPDLTETELERRFWRKCLLQKEGLIK